MRTPRNRPMRLATVLALAVISLGASGCGHGHGHSEVVVVEPVVDPLGDVEVDNQTDLSGTFENLFFFEMVPVGTALFTGNLLPFDVFPGEIVFLGSFVTDFYDAEAQLDLGIITFFDVLIEAGFTTTFEVF